MNFISSIDWLHTRTSRIKQRKKEKEKMRHNVNHIVFFIIEWLNSITFIIKHWIDFFLQITHNQPKEYHRSSWIRWRKIIIIFRLVKFFPSSKNYDRLFFDSTPSNKLEKNDNFLCFVLLTLFILNNLKFFFLFVRFKSNCGLKLIENFNER